MFKMIFFIIIQSAAAFSFSTSRYENRVSFNPVMSKSYLKMSSSVATSPIELTKDGGVKKITLIPGQGRQVETGDILAIEYAASVKGGILFAKGEQEQCIVKDGSMIKGWDIGISSMKVGEKARISLSPQYAYGALGISPVIPGNAELEVELRVQAWLGNQLRPETLFQKDLDIDPFISSTPEAIQADFDNKQVTN